MSMGPFPAADVAPLPIKPHPYALAQGLHPGAQAIQTGGKSPHGRPAGARAFPEGFAMGRLRRFALRHIWAFRQLAAAAALLGVVAAADGQELKIGLSAEPSAMDPHFQNL